jgi:hypothetical protein
MASLQESINQGKVYEQPNTNAMDKHIRDLFGWCSRRKTVHFHSVGVIGKRFFSWVVIISYRPYCSSFKSPSPEQDTQRDFCEA